MKFGIVTLSVILIIVFVSPVTAKTVGDLQKEEGGIIVNHDYSQAIELTNLKDEIVNKQIEIQQFEKRILPAIQWNIPPDIMTLSANGKLEGNFFLATGNIRGEFNTESSAKSETLYEGFDPYISEEMTKELLFFTRSLLEENGECSSAEQILKIQLQELENKGINESEKMHIFYVQRLYNSVVDIENELNSSVKSVDNKMQTERENEDAKYRPIKLVLFLVVVLVAAYFAAGCILKIEEWYGKKMEK